MHLYIWQILITNLKTLDSNLFIYCAAAQSSLNNLNIILPRISSTSKQYLDLISIKSKTWESDVSFDETFSFCNLIVFNYNNLTVMGWQSYFLSRDSWFKFLFTSLRMLLFPSVCVHALHDHTNSTHCFYQLHTNRAVLHFCRVRQAKIKPVMQRFLLNSQTCWAALRLQQVVIP